MLVVCPARLSQLPPKLLTKPSAPLETSLITSPHQLVQPSRMPRLHRSTVSIRLLIFVFRRRWRTSPTKIWDSSYCMVSNCVLILFPLLQPPHAKSKDFWHHSLSWSVLLPQFSEVTNRAQKVQVLVLTLASLTCRMFTWPFLSIQEPLSFSIWLKTRTLWYLKRHTTAQFYYYEHFSLFWSLRTIVQLKKIKFVKTVDSAA